MADSYSKIYIHVIFTVYGRKNLIDPSWETELHKYITGTITNKGQKMIVINGVENHLHFLIGMKPTCCLSDLVREVKKSSTVFVKEQGLSKTKFQWMEGFSAFSWTHHSLDKIVGYIERQKEHHKKVDFKDEYIALLKEHDVDYKDEYLFD